MNAGAQTRRGRPRSEQADRAILDAALELFADAGFDGLTVEGVAARAGVGKATIYRRYPCKVDLVMASARFLTEVEAPQPDTGRVEDDLRATARGLVHLLTETAAGGAVRQIVAELDRNPELRRAHAEFVDGRRAGTIAAVRRGMERGDLAPDTDPELVADLIAGPIFYRHLVSGARLDTAYADELVTRILESAATPVLAPAVGQRSGSRKA